MESQAAGPAGYVSHSRVSQTSDKNVRLVRGGCAHLHPTSARHATPRHAAMCVDMKSRTEAAVSLFLFLPSGVQPSVQSDYLYCSLSCYVTA